MSDPNAEIEQFLGRPIPEDLRSYLRGDVGEIRLPAEIDIPDASPWTDLVASLYTMEQALVLLREDASLIPYGTRDIPAGMIPIGDNGNGDLYAISIRKFDFGSIHFLFHEMLNPDDESRESSHLLATGFKEWIANFRPAPPRPPTPDWQAIRAAKLKEILESPSPPARWKFWAKR